MQVYRTTQLNFPVQADIVSFTSMVDLYIMLQLGRDCLELATDDKIQLS
jgi:hypothetical protein